MSPLDSLPAALEVESRAQEDTRLLAAPDSSQCLGGITMSTTTGLIVALVATVLISSATIITLVVVYNTPPTPSSNWQHKAECPADYVDNPPVILVSMDGFRASYLERGLTPVLEQLIAEGVSASYMKPSYPTVTFPNHYTIVTGLYPESHGIIANKFYDPEFGTTFSLGTEESLKGRWWLGEPMWNTLTRQGKKSATYFWPGSDADIGGLHPTYWYLYNESVPFETRIDQAIEWVTMPADTRPQWITLYFNEPDHTGHESGPDSDEVNAVLTEMNLLMEYLVTSLTNVSLLDCVNLIILADHGMAGGGASFVIKLEDYIPDVYDLSYTYTGAFTRISLKTYDDDLKYAMMRNLSCKRTDMRQYEREGLPSRYHFSNNRRIEDIVLDFDAGRYGSVSSSYYNLGNHGYDNYFTPMNALFVGRGPAFKVGTVVEPFQNIQLYNLMCYLCGVAPAPNNGTAGALNDMLLSPQPVEELPPEELPPTAIYPDSETLPDRLHVSGCVGDFQSEQPWMSSLNMTEADQALAAARHLPWGAPQHGNLSADLLMLYHQDHVTAYSKTLKMPLWTSFTMTMAPEGSAVSNWTSDIRLSASESVTCQDYETFDNSTEVIMAPLFHPLFSWDSSLPEIPYQVSNAVPSTSQQQMRWTELMQHLVLRWLGGGQLHLTVGPVFDNNADSMVDNFTDFSRHPMLPSDWFAVVTQCHSGGAIGSCDPLSLNTRSFIYPTVLVVGNCLENSEYALEFSGTLKDVEIITGLKLFPNLTYSQRTRLETAVHDVLFDS